MVPQIPPQKVAEAFVEQYYIILKICPENVHKFYQESSLLAWPGPDGVATPVTTLSGINAKIMSSDYKSCHVEVKTVDALESLEEGVIVAVTGLLIRMDSVKRSFCQTFFLAKQESGFFVLNDILRFCNMCKSRTNSAANDYEKSNQAVPSVQSTVPHNDGPASNAKTVVQSGNIKETLDISDPKDTDFKVASAAPSVASCDTMRSILVPAPNVEEKAQKTTYASIVAKRNSATTPKTICVPSEPDCQDVAPSTNKPSTPSSNVAAKLPIASSVSPNSSAYAEARVYIGGLPYDITKQGVVEVVKRFGPVRRSPDSILLRRHEDGFCCGFVEFESADAARRAIKVRHVKFGKKEAYITPKRSVSIQGK